MYEQTMSPKAGQERVLIMRILTLSKKNKERVNPVKPRPINILTKQIRTSPRRVSNAKPNS